MIERYGSRKFIVSLLVLGVAGVLAYFDKEVPAGVLTAIIISYNGMQGLIDNTIAKNGNAS